MFQGTEKLTLITELTGFAHLSQHSYKKQYFIQNRVKVLNFCIYRMTLSISH